MKTLRLDRDVALRKLLMPSRVEWARKRAGVGVVMGHAGRGCGKSDYQRTGELSLARAYLRRFGWVLFIELNGSEIWVGPKGELETKDVAYAKMVRRHG
jgi:hypothetical protein